MARQATYLHSTTNPNLAYVTFVVILKLLLITHGHLVLAMEENLKKKNLNNQCQHKSTCLAFCEKVDPESIDLLRAKVDCSSSGSMYQESMDQDPVYVPSTKSHLDST